MSMIIDLLSGEELDRLDEFRLDRNRNDGEEYIEGLDEGILCVSELDGFLTAVVSGPAMILPSDWMPIIWGDVEPEWKDADEFEEIFSLMGRHLNGIVNNLMSSETFLPLFLESEDPKSGKKYLVVDEWCEGYMRGVRILEDQWGLDTIDMTILFAPISTFASKGGWAKLEKMTDKEIENIQNAIVPNIEEIHAYWLRLREHDTPVTAQTYRKDTPTIRRNDVCPCGSGKKFKKCCLH